MTPCELTAGVTALANLLACRLGEAELNLLALVLTQLEGVSYEEAARLLSATEGTVKSRVNRAKEYGAEGYDLVMDRLESKGLLPDFRD